MTDLKSLKNRYSRRGGRALPRLADKAKPTPHDVVNLSNVRTDGGTQPRESMDMDLVGTYAARMSWDASSESARDPEGQRWPEITVFDDGTSLWLADGFHRLHAARKAGLSRFQATIHQGNLEQAILHSLGANASHGKRRTQADIKRVIERVLFHPEWARRSNNWLARICKVSDGTIKRHRERLEHAREIPFYASLESTNAAYYDRTPPFELDEDGYLIVPEPAPDTSPTKEGTAPKVETEGRGGEAFVSEDLDGADVILAFPSSPSDCLELVDALASAPALVITPINSNTPMAYEGARALQRLVDELGMMGPRPIWIAEHQRHYFIWSDRDIELSGSIKDTKQITGGRHTVVCGQPLGGW